MRLRRLGVILAFLGLVGSPLRAAAGCVMMDRPNEQAAAPAVAESHAGHGEAHVPDPGSPISHERCPDLASCTPSVAPASEVAALAVDTPTSLAPISAPVAKRIGPVATLEPPPPRS